MYDRRYRPRVSALHNHVSQLVRGLNVRPRVRHGHFFSHIIREGNGRADALASTALQGQALTLLPNRVPYGRPFVRGRFDGGHKEGRASGGWTLETAAELDGRNVPMWEFTAGGAFPLPRRGTSVEAELEAATMAIAAATAYCSGDLRVRQGRVHHPWCPLAPLPEPLPAEPPSLPSYCPPTRIRKIRAKRAVSVDPNVDQSGIAPSRKVRRRRGAVSDV